MKRNEDRGRAERNSALPLFLLRRGLYKYHTRKGIAMRVQGKREVIKLLTDVTYSRVDYWFGLSMKDMKMDILMPKESKGHKHWPLIVWLCGGGFTSMDHHIWIPELMEYARKGYVVASVQYRVKGEGEFPAPWIDIKSAIRYLRAHSEQYCIDTEKITVMGESAGGCLAALTGLTSGSTVFDIGEYLDFSSEVNNVVSFYGPVFEEKDIVGLVPPFEFAYGASEKGLKIPQLLLQGDADKMVDKSLMDKYQKKLDYYKVPNQYVVIEDAGHGDAMFYQTEIKELVDRFIRENTAEN